MKVIRTPLKLDETCNKTSLSIILQSGLGWENRGPLLMKKQEPWHGEDTTNGDGKKNCLISQG